MTAILVGSIVGILFSAFCLWAGMKITKVEGNFLAMLLIAAISTILGFIPMVGWLLGPVAMFFLICKWTGASFWPDAVLMVVVARGVGMFVGIALTSLVSKM
ncbi:MAG: hypothetical protein GXP32_08935 [Kiritimatiellaeota bacterium]|nr:hypothetical protein [Kiritimatiellota bacterium]